jgi:hypothetical protein
LQWSQDGTLWHLCLISDHLESIVLLYLCLLIFFDTYYKDKVYQLHHRILFWTVMYHDLHNQKLFLNHKKVLPTINLLLKAFKIVVVNLQVSFSVV